MIRRTIHTLVLATVLAPLSLVVATAEPKTPDKPDRPTPSACKAEGTPLFQIDQLDAAKVVSSSRIYNNGAWALDDTTDGKTPSLTGCADKATVESFRTLLASAPWKISHPIHCEMMTSKSTKYSSNGKLLFTERACNADALDDKSEKNLAELVALVAKTTSPGPVAGGCKASGDVAFQVAHGAVPGAKVTTSVLKVFDTGAWAFAETKGDGTAGASKVGCLDKAQRARVDDDLKGAPWTVTTPRVRCMARSQTFTTYSVHGKDVFTKQVCGATIDDVSAKKLEDLDAMLAKLAP